MLRYLTARSVLTPQVARLFWGQQADSSLLCDTSVLCLPALVCSGSRLCRPVLRGRGGGTHSTPAPAGLRWWRGKTRVCFQCAASIRVQEAQWGTWTGICIMLAVLFPWWKGSIPGDVEHRDLDVGVECNGTSVLHASDPMLEQTSTRMEGFHHSSC